MERLYKIKIVKPEKFEILEEKILELKKNGLIKDKISEKEFITWLKTMKNLDNEIKVF